MNTKKSSLVEEGDLQQPAVARGELWRGALQKGAECQQSGGAWGVERTEVTACSHHIEGERQAGARRTGPATQTKELRGARGTVGEVGLRGWRRGQDLGTGKNWDDGQGGRVQTDWGRALRGVEKDEKGLSFRRPPQRSAGKRRVPPLFLDELIFLPGPFEKEGKGYSGKAFQRASAIGRLRPYISSVFFLGACTRVVAGGRQENRDQNGRQEFEHGISVATADTWQPIGPGQSRAGDGGGSCQAAFLQFFTT